MAKVKTFSAKLKSTILLKICECTTFWHVPSSQGPPNRAPEAPTIDFGSSAKYAYRRRHPSLFTPSSPRNHSKWVPKSTFKKSTKEEGNQEHPDDPGSQPTLYVHNRAINLVRSDVVPAKDANQHAADAIKQFMNELGYSELILKRDQESSIMSNEAHNAITPPSALWAKRRSEGSNAMTPRVP